jgi:hypothetical protein
MAVTNGLIQIALSLVSADEDSAERVIQTFQMEVLYYTPNLTYNNEVLS